MEAISGKRRVWFAEERERIVAEATALGASVAAIALQHGVIANFCPSGSATRDRVGSVEVVVQVP